MAAPRLRTGADFLSDLRNKPRAVYVDGERVTNVAEQKLSAAARARSRDGSTLRLRPRTATR